MAGFRIGRDRGSHNARQGQAMPPHGRPPQAPPHAPQGWPTAPEGQAVNWGRPAAAPNPGAGRGTGYGSGGPGAGGPVAGGPVAGDHVAGEPEYFAPPAADPYAADQPGHTRQFSIGDEFGEAYGDGATYAAGGSAAPAGPRLPWKQLLSGIVLRPNATFQQMRDHQVWLPALLVTFVYGLLAVFGLDEAREEVLSATLSNAVPFVLMTGVAVVLSGLVLGAVTHTLARQFGGDGAWAPTIGLAMLVMSLTDAPRLLFALFLGGDAAFVQVLAWLTWGAAAALFTSLVSRSHDLPWPKALGASAIQLLALLFLMKLGTL
ncbi:MULTISPECIES: Yip1 family protein [unclassified Streptomyces]|uniref:Yip1 family protein n=1 Tax=unclassified Streptomyces TaxID=2593676 RepID=UPI0022B61BDC|nr:MULTISPECIES: Yip1 family protein [unclassified Streptomyces]MCZ7415380.1 Yip1 family protein [Streptomyces sp. WMMC897]MCZ7432302.1 Yip1 family protein [Streptomyces sp. WMMC1477]